MKEIQLSEIVKRSGPKPRRKVVIGNIWKSNPRVPIHTYPGWDYIGDIVDKLTDNLFSPKPRINIYHRDFQHKTYTMYKTKKIIKVTKNGKTRRVRYYGLVKEK